MVWMNTMVVVLALSLVPATPGYEVGGSCEDRCGGGQHALCGYFCTPAVHQDRAADQSDKKNEEVGRRGRGAKHRRTLTINKLRTNGSQPVLFLF